MVRKRDIDAYDRRAAKMCSERELEARDLGAIVTVYDAEHGRDVTGALVGFRHRIGVGLFGNAIWTDVTVCPECIGGHTCTGSSDIDVRAATLVSIRRSTPADLAVGS